MTSPSIDPSRAVRPTPNSSRSRQRRWIAVRVAVPCLCLVVCGVTWYLAPWFLKLQTRRALAARDYIAARSTLDRLDGWFGLDGESCLLRARLCRKLGDWTGVQESLIRARDRKFPVDLLEREQWLALAQNGQLRQAEPHLSRLLTDPRDDGAEICEAFVNGYFVNHRMAETLRLLDAWIADFPSDAEPRLIRGKIRAEQQFLKDAESDLRFAWSLDPRSVSAALELADVLVLERQIDESLQIYRRIAATREHPLRARLGESKALRLLNQPETARIVAQQILTTDSSNRDAIVELGLAELDLNQYDAAVATLQHALELNPRSLVVRQALARALRATGDSEHATEHAQYVAEAQSALQRADQLATDVTQHPNDAETRYEIGSIYLRYAVPERGVQWLKSVLNCDPQHRAAQQALDDYYANRSESVSTAAMTAGINKSRIDVDATTPKHQDHSTTIQFHERMPDSDAPFAYRNGEEAERSSILEGMGGGAAVFDYDQDGRLDLLFPGGGSFSGEHSLAPNPPALFRNHGEWQFRRCERQAGLNVPTHYSHGTAVADYDSDGFEDVLVTGYGGIQLLRNQGDGTFVDVTADAKLDDRLWSTSAAWGDFDSDGNLDLYVAHYVDWSFDHDPSCPAVDGKRRERCPPQRYGPLPDVLYRSRGDGEFFNASDESGLRRDGKGLGVVLADLDLDGDLDIYVANDTVGNFLYQNDGRGHFEEIGVASGTAFNDLGAPDGSMGVAITDYNLDGLPDLWVVNYERETIALYKNLGHCAFEHVSQSTGVSVVGTMFVGFGTVFLDADRDGDEDVFVANGHVLRFPNNAPVRQRPLMFENLEGRRFVNVAPQAGEYCRAAHIGRGLAHGDLDNDGDLDLAVSHLNEPVSLLENTTESSGGWFKVRLIGRVSNRDAIGARLVLRTSSGQQIRQISSGDSYLSHSDRTVYWGVPTGAVIESLTIEWPRGKPQTLAVPTSSHVLTVREPFK